MNTHVLLRQPESLVAYMRKRSADVAMNRNGYLEVPADSDFLRPRTNAIVAGMKLITDEPARHTHFPWRDLLVDCYGQKYTQEVGLRCSAPDDSENKYTFHYNLGMMHELLKSGVPLPEYGPFFNALEELDQWSLTIALAVAGVYDDTNRRRVKKTGYPSSMVRKIMRGSRIIRVLRYRKKDDAAPDAKPHVDRSLFTVHAWSSHPGLKICAPDGSWWPVNETAYNSVAVFPGEKFAAVTRGIWSFGTPHGVRDERRAHGSRTDDRYAIVCFVHPEPLPDDAEWLLANRDRIEEHEATLAL